MDVVIKSVGQRHDVKMCVSGYISTVNIKMYCIFEKSLSNKVEVKFRLQSIYGTTVCEHTIVFELKNGIGFIPSKYEGVYQCTRDFVYLCTICGGDKKRIICFMCKEYFMYLYVRIL